MQLLFVVFLIVPAFHPKHMSIHLLDILAIIGVGGIWLAAFIWQIKKHSLLPMYDSQIVVNEPQEAPSHAH